MHTATKESAPAAKREQAEEPALLTLTGEERQIRGLGADVTGNAIIRNLE